MRCTWCRAIAHHLEAIVISPPRSLSCGCAPVLFFSTVVSGTHPILARLFFFFLLIKDDIKGAERMPPVNVYGEPTMCLAWPRNS